MSFGQWAVWGFAATIVLTTMMAGSQGVGLTRMNLPFMLGTLFTMDRDRARVIGIGVHLVNGWVLSLVYLALFDAWGRAGILRGILMGGVHALFVLFVVMPAFPGFHPRMAGEHRGPSAPRQLEPPGFMALHYGYQTPVSLLLAHIVYGAILGAVYRP